MNEGLTVIKVGGSLFDWPKIGERLALWLKFLRRPDVILLAGGGRAADIVRDLDSIHRFGEERSHFLALRSLTLSAYALVELLSPTRLVAVVARLSQCERLWRQDGIPVLDLGSFTRTDANPDNLPHCWSVTSDSLAARVAAVTRARELVLMKSVTIPAEMSWEEASRHGYVDEHFPMVARGLQIRAVNLRDWSP
jgi:aspartokinase-like uncharacterized kinase